MTPDGMAAIHRACFTTPRPWTAAEFAALLANTYCFCTTAPQGFALGRAVAGEAELLTLAVLPDAQGRGIGRALVAAFLDTARVRGSDTAFLEVAETNGAAIHLYLTSGFVQTGRRPKYYHQPDGTAIAALNFARDLGQNDDSLINWKNNKPG